MEKAQTRNLGLGNMNQDSLVKQDIRSIAISHMLWN